MSSFRTSGDDLQRVCLRVALLVLEASGDEGGFIWGVGRASAAAVSCSIGDE